MKKYIIVLCFIVIGLVYFYFFNQETPSSLKIAILQTASHPTLDYISYTIKKSIQREDCLCFVKEYNAQGDILSLNILSSNIMEDASFNSVVAIGYPALLSLISYGCKNNLKMPIWYCAVSYPEQCGIDRYAGKVFGFSDKVDSDLLIEKLQELSLKNKIGYLYCLNDIGSSTLLVQLKKRLNLFEVGVNQENQLPDAMELMCRNTDIIVIPTDNVVAGGIQIVFNIAKKYNKQLFVMDEILYKKGHCAYWVGIDYAEQAQRLSDEIIKTLI